MTRGGGRIEGRARVPIEGLAEVTTMSDSRMAVGPCAHPLLQPASEAMGASSGNGRHRASPTGRDHGHDNGSRRMRR